ncbi:MAG: tRNA (adenosine(37)-N6)-threonylcarbamoyltransferase complex dimerization subunit type 1 TsaB [Carboxydocellales bacterium]
MFVLALDSATLAASAAVITAEKLVAERFINNKLTHSETLLPIIQQVLVDAGITPQNLGGIAVTCGPGSFTGLRIGLATAKGLAQVLECPLVGIPTLDALAFNLVGNKGLICPILDARKQQVYTALYSTNPGESGLTAGLPLRPALQRLNEYQALSINELICLLDKYAEQGSVTFLGDGVAVYAQALQHSLGDRALMASRALNYPRAAAVAELGLARITAGEDDHWSKLNALYLRASEAETTWAKKHGCGKER